MRRTARLGLRLFNKRQLHSKASPKLALTALEAQRHKQLMNYLQTKPPVGHLTHHDLPIKSDEYFLQVTGMLAAHAVKQHYQTTHGDHLNEFIPLFHGHEYGDVVLSTTLIDPYTQAQLLASAGYSATKIVKTLMGIDEPEPELQLRQLVQTRYPIDVNATIEKYGLSSTFIHRIPDHLPPVGPGSQAEVVLNQIVRAREQKKPTPWLLVVPQSQLWSMQCDYSVASQLERYDVQIFENDASDPFAAIQFRKGRQYVQTLMEPAIIITKTAALQGGPKQSTHKLITPAQFHICAEHNPLLEYAQQGEKFNVWNADLLRRIWEECEQTVAQIAESKCHSMYTP